MFKTLILSFFLASSAWSAQVVVWPVGIGARFERDETQNLKMQSTYHFAVAMELSEFSFELSRDLFASKSSEGNVSIKREYQDFLGWINYRIWGEPKLKLMLGAGFGFYEEKVTTRIASFEDESTTQLEFFTGGGAELRWFPLESELVLSVGARLLYSQTFDPELQPHLFTRLGWRF